VRQVSRGTGGARTVNFCTTGKTRNCLHVQLIACTILPVHSIGSPWPVSLSGPAEIVAWITGVAMYPRYWLLRAKDDSSGVGLGAACNAAQPVS
jgi:hypothetical protein